MKEFCTHIPYIIYFYGCDGNHFIYVGGESDTWVKDALYEAVNKDMIVLNLMELLGEEAKEEEYVEGRITPHLERQLL